MEKRPKPVLLASSVLRFGTFKKHCIHTESFFNCSFCNAILSLMITHRHGKPHQMTVILLWSMLILAASSTSLAYSTRKFTRLKIRVTFFILMSWDRGERKDQHRSVDFGQWQSFSLSNNRYATFKMQTF